MLKSSSVCRAAGLAVLSVYLLLISGCGGVSGEALLEKGMSELESGSFEKAVMHLVRAREQLPEDPSVNLNLGIAYWKSDQYELAVSSLEKAAELAVDETAPLEFLGVVYMELENWDSALSAFENAIDRSYRSARLLTYMAVVKLNNGDLIEARRILSEALKTDPVYAPALYNMGVLYGEKAFNIREAKKYFRRFVEAANQPGRTGEPVDEIYITKAESFLGPPEEQATVDSGQKTETVKKPVERSAEKKPVKNPEKKKPAEKQPEKKNTAAELLAEAEKAIDKEEYVSALMNLRKACAEAPDDPEPLWALAMLYDKHLDYGKKAEQAYRQFKKKFPDDRRAKLVILPGEGTEERGSASAQGTASDKQKNSRIHESQKAEDTAAGKAQEFFEQGLTHHEAGDWNRAIENYELALEQNGRMYNAVYNMGLVYKKKGRLNDAKKAFGRAVDMEPGMVKAWYMLALVHKELKEYRDAARAGEKALAIQPDYVKAHFLMGIIYSMQDRPDIARKYFNSCIQSAPDNPIASRAREHLDNLP